MKKINTGRALLGGLVAALIIDMIEGVMHGVVLKSDWATAMQALGKSGEVSGAAIGIYVCTRYRQTPATTSTMRT